MYWQVVTFLSLTFICLLFSLSRYDQFRSVTFQIFIKQRQLLNSKFWMLTNFQIKLNWLWHNSKLTMFFLKTRFHRFTFLFLWLYSKQIFLNPKPMCLIHFLWIPLEQDSGIYTQTKTKWKSKCVYVFQTATQNI